MTRKQFPTATLLAAMLMCVAAGAAHAQRVVRDQNTHSQLMSELAQLRRATALEAAGNYAEAEQIVAEILRNNPASLTGLLTMERLLGAQARLRDILPYADRLLEVDPTSVVGHQTRLRVASQLNDVAGLEAAVRNWIRVSPHLETPWREAAVIWRRRGDTDRAIALLEEGRARIDRRDALALELGDAHAAAGNHEQAAEHWARAIGEQGRGLMLVQRRLQGLTDGGARIIPHLVDRLLEKPTTFARMRGAAMLAIDAGLGRRAIEAIALLEKHPLEPQQREQLTIELARRADGAALNDVALRLYRGLLATVPDTAAALAIRSRVAELALITGDTALAAATYRQLENAAAAGSPQRRQAVALRIQLTAREGDMAAAVSDYEAFRAEFPKSPEVDATAAVLGSMLLDAGDLATAGRVLSNVNGAQAAQLRGLLHLRRGEIEQARNELLMAAPQLRGPDATATIALATLLSRLSARGGELVAAVTAAPAAERVAQIQTAAEAARRLPASERAAVLDFLAESAEAAGAEADAEALRREIVETLPRTHEAPAALLALARTAVDDPEAEEEARVLLEKLIVEYPQSALAPQARTELERLQQH